MDTGPVVENSGVLIMPRRFQKVLPLRVALDRAHPDPLHVQIGNQLRRAILGRRLVPGSKIPSSRLMAEEWNCARGTILSALEPLVAEGYLVSHPGAGIFVATSLPDDMLVRPRIVDAVQEAGLQPKPLLSSRARDLVERRKAKPTARGELPIAFPIGQPDRRAFPFPLWAKLMEREWRRPTWQVAGAPHPFGHLGLREAIASYLGAARGFACDPRSIVITSGIRESISLFARIVLDVGDRAWVEEPCFPGVHDALATASVSAVSVPVDESGFSLKAALALAPDVRLTVVTPSHQFPFGTVLPMQRRRALLDWAKRTNS